MGFIAANWGWILAGLGGLVHIVRGFVHTTIVAKTGKDHGVLLDSIDEKLGTLVNLTGAGSAPGDQTKNPPT